MSIIPDDHRQPQHSRYDVPAASYGPDYPGITGPASIQSMTVPLPNGWELGYLINPNGGAWPTVLEPGATRINADGIDAPHEQLGPLPKKWAFRTRYAPVMCGASTKEGRRCRNRTVQAGRCWRHVGAARTYGAGDQKQVQP